jgi:hypothetical protein
MNISINVDSIKKYFSITLAVITIILFYLLRCENGKLEEQVQINEQANSELKQHLNKEGLQVSQIQILSAEKEKAFLKMKFQDSVIQQLQEVVKDYKGKLKSATVLINNSTSSGGSVTTITKYDTIIKDSVIMLYPTYETAWNSKWEIGSIKATKDSIFRDIKIMNEFEITMGAVKNGMFKKKTNEVIVKNLNPNTLTDELRTFEVRQNDKRINLGLQAGYGIGFSTMRPTTYVGVGVSFNLIGIK